MPRALVIGGSLGGLLAAHLLRTSAGTRSVFERNTEPLTSRGVGLGTHPQLIAVLRRAGVAFDETMGIKVPKVICLDRSGKIIVEQPTGRVMSGWARLYRALRDALPAEKYRLGRTLIGGSKGRRAALPRSSPMARASAVMCGRRGRHPFHGARAIPAAGRTGYAGYVAWRAVLDETSCAGDIRREIFELYTFCLPEGEQLLGYPVPGRDNEVEVGRRGYNIVWYRPADHAALTDLCTDAKESATAPAYRRR